MPERCPQSRFAPREKSWTCRLVSSLAGPLDPETILASFPPRLSPWQTADAELWQTPTAGPASGGHERCPAEGWWLFLTAAHVLPQAKHRFLFSPLDCWHWLLFPYTTPYWVNLSAPAFPPHYISSTVSRHHRNSAHITADTC